MVSYNPMEPSYVRDPYPTLDRMREEAPVLFNPAVQTWMLTRYRDIWSLLRDPRARALPAERVVLGPMSRAYEVGPFQRAMRNWVVLKDGSDHTRLRNLLNKSFTPKIIAGLEARVLEITDELLDDVIAQGEADVMRDFTDPLPMLVIAGQLGIPREHRARVKKWSDDIARAMDPIRGYAHREMGDRTVEDMFGFLRELAEHRRRKPQDDLLSLMVAAEDEGERLTMDELLATCLLLLLGGNETTTALIGNALVALLDNRDQEAKLRANPSLMENAIEEFLRYDSPLHTIGRLLAAEIQIGHARLPEGARVVCILGAANRDPEVFDDPDLLDVERTDVKHLAFGTGTHFCLGSHLARLEARVALGRFLERIPHFEKTVRHVAYRDTIAIRGPKALPLKMTPRT